MLSSPRRRKRPRSPTKCPNQESCIPVRLTQGPGRTGSNRTRSACLLGSRSVPRDTQRRRGRVTRPPCGLDKQPCQGYSQLQGHQRERVVPTCFGAVALREALRGGAPPAVTTSPKRESREITPKSRRCADAARKVFRAAREAFHWGLPGRLQAAVAIRSASAAIPSSSQPPAAKGAEAA